MTTTRLAGTIALAIWLAAPAAAIAATNSPAPTPVPPVAAGPGSVSALPAQQVIVAAGQPYEQSKDEKPSTIISAIASLAQLLWPCVVALGFFLFRKELGGLLDRLVSVKVAGAEATLKPTLDALQQEAAKAQAEAPATPQQPPSAAEAQAAQATKEADKTVEAVMAEARRSPRLALMLLSAEIDRTARQIGAATGHRHPTLRASVEFWRPQLPEHAAAAFRLFSDVRNRIVHGQIATDAEALRAIDSGLELLRALKAIQLERNVVSAVDVPIFSDEACTQRHPGAGIILETTSPDGTVNFRIFPTTAMHFRVGMVASWEWSFDRVWPDAWYRDPATGEVKLAWNSSAEFIGRDLEQV